MDVKDWMGHRHLSTTMRYVHHQPRHEAAERLGRHFSGAAAELEALLGDPAAVRVGGSEAPKRAKADDSGDWNRTRTTRGRGNSG